MKKPTLQEVTCPHCHGTQTEPLGAISTNCRACGKYFKLSAKTGARNTRAPKDTREVICVKCGAPNLVASAALSTQCRGCANYIELGDKVVRGVQTAKFYAHDNVLFDDGCSFKGMEATGRRMEVRGKVFSRLRATEEIVAKPGCDLSGELCAPVVRIERGAKVHVQDVTCDRLTVSGAMEISGTLRAGEIVLNDGAAFSGRLNVPESKLNVSAGATVQFESIICAELTVEGHVKLGTTLAADRIAVVGGGTLTASTVRAARIEVSPGGLLQALIEKHIPVEKPKVPEVQVEEKTEAKTKYDAG